MTPSHLTAIEAMLDQMKAHASPWGYLSKEEREALSAMREWCKEAIGLLSIAVNCGGSLVLQEDVNRARALLANFPEVTR